MWGGTHDTHTYMVHSHELTQTPAHTHTATLFCSDNHLIRAIDGSTHAVSAVVGSTGSLMCASGTGAGLETGLCSPVGLAMDTTNNILYIAVRMLKSKSVIFGSGIRAGTNAA